MTITDPAAYVKRLLNIVQLSTDRMDVLTHGAPHLSAELLTTAPADAGRDGGIAPILVSTLLILGVCMAVAVPLGIGSALLLGEFSRNARGFCVQ